MEYQLNDEIEGILAGIRPSMGGADVRLKDVRQGIITLEYFKALSNPSACHVDRTRLTKDILIETLQDKLKRVVPEFKEIIVIGEE